MPQIGNFKANPYQQFNMENILGLDANSTVGSVYNGYSPLPTESTSTDIVDDSSKSCKKSSSNVSGKSAQPTIIVNTCLSFIYSERMRQSSPTVVEEVSKLFTLDEIKDAREALYRGSGVGRYMYKPPNHPATPKQISDHCVSSIIAKLNELDYKLNIPPVKIVCPSEELYYLVNLFNLVFNPDHDKSSPLEDRVRVLEKKVNQIESHQVHSNTNRQKIISDVRNSNHSFTPQSAKRPRSAEKESWVDVTNKPSRAGNPPPKRSKPSFWGKADTVANKDLLGVEFHDVFLFNYRKIVRR